MGGFKKISGILHYLFLIKLVLKNLMHFFRYTVVVDILIMLQTSSKIHIDFEF